MRGILLAFKTKFCNVVLVFQIVILTFLFWFTQAILFAGDNISPVEMTEPSKVNSSSIESHPYILFGDLHNHSSNSLDAMAMNLPIVGRNEIRTPEMSCEFARFCSQVDFWALTDHAEEQTSLLWKENISAIRQCQAKYGSDLNRPGPLCFLGWEWTDSNPVASKDYGHHNIVLKGISDWEIPIRPFAAPSGFADFNPKMISVLYAILWLYDPENKSTYKRLYDRVVSFTQKNHCDPKVEPHLLPDDCHEEIRDPGALVSHFKRYGIDALIIPHGMTWGMHHHKNSSWPLFSWYNYDPFYSPVVEIDSGHGNAESYRTWRHVIETEDGSLICPDPTPDFEPCCWRAGEIVRKKSRACRKDPTGDKCKKQVDQAKQNFVDAGRRGNLTIPEAGPEEWLDCGQCRDCYQPPLDHIAARSVQAALTISDENGSGAPWRYQFGFIGSSDSHRAGPGAGYKEFVDQSDGYGPSKKKYAKLVKKVGSWVTPDYWRQNSYLYSGSLVAVHAENRTKDAIWEALTNRRVYATSGDRILLWFDLIKSNSDRITMGGKFLQPEAPFRFDNIQSDSSRVFMGGKTVQSETPTFEVKAIGAHKQAPGCPQWVHDDRSTEFIDSVCFGECYNPTNERHLITHIEVVKIELQQNPDEPMENLIHDPFLRLECPPNPDGCTVRFTDPDFATKKRHAAYYVRAYQEPTPQFNGGNLRCNRDENGHCVKSNPCDNSYLGENDDCLTMQHEVAWASPIFLENGL